jgi:hypothetical protein
VYKPGFNFWQGKEIFLISKNVQTGFGTHSAFSSMATMDSFPDTKLPGHKIDLVLRRRMSGAIPLLPLLHGTETTFSLSFVYIYHSSMVLSSKQ